MLTVSVPAYPSSSPSLLLSSLPSFHPALILLLIPLSIIAYTSHSFFTHERSRHSSISVTAVDRDQSPNSLKRSRALKDFRANFGAARKEEKGETEEERKVREVREYEGEFLDLTKVAEECSKEEREEMGRMKELYWKLQNLEDHPAAIDEARTKLLELLDLTTSEALSSPSSTILSVPSYTPSSLQTFLSAAHTSSATRYEAYIARRRAGAPRHMFPNKEFAREWLKLAGVVKYVDGGWLGGVLDVASARAEGLKGGRRRGIVGDNGKLERKCGKMAWQVISEEFGDGDIEKNHVYVYERLLDELKVGATTAEGHTQPGHVRGFDGLRDDQGSPRCWTAAVAQQCIGLLASTREYFPEALGFNMAYESLPYHLLVTTRELRELGINDYYFALHVTIDNADSGHAAIARVAVEKYLDGVRERDGEEAMKMMWRRVQAGYILAEGLPTTPSGPKEFEQVPRGDGMKMWKSVKPNAAEVVSTETERKVADLMVRKSAAAEKMHCPSRLLISGQTIEQWLDPSKLTQDRALRFIRALSEKRPWIKKGDPAGSKLVMELEWGGRMFGAFSRAETELMRSWVAEMGEEGKDRTVEGTYEDFVGAEEVNDVEEMVDESRLARRMRDVLPANFEDDVLSRWRAEQPTTHKPFDLSIPIIGNNAVNSALPLWLVSTSLLEQFPLSPTKFATPLGMLVLRLLRTQLGFLDLHEREDICAGIDDVQHGDDEMIGLWELAEKIWGAELAGGGLKRALMNVQDEEVKETLADLLELRTRPYSNQAVLLGLTAGFARGLHASPIIREKIGNKVEQNLLDRMVSEQGEAIEEYLGTGSNPWKQDGWESDFALGQRKVYDLLEALQ